MRKRLIALLLCLALSLSACGQGNVETPEPTPTAEETATPAPSSTPAPEPEPDPEEVTELWGFPLDDTHDAFEVPTGGKLGTVLVTVEIEESNDLDWDYYLTISVWRADDTTTPIQSFETGSNVLNGYHGHNDNIRDVNFDGYMDFGWRYFFGNQPILYHYWIWDEEQGLFVAEPEFDQISCPQFNEETGVISGYARGGLAGAAGTHTFHQWIGGKLICIRKITTFPYGADILNEIRLTIEEPVEGTLTEVYRHETDIATAFEEVEKWRDLNYHGE